MSVAWVLCPDLASCAAACSLLGCVYSRVSCNSIGVLQWHRRRTKKHHMLSLPVLTPIVSALCALLAVLPPRPCHAHCPRRRVPAPRPAPACRLQGISDADVGTLQGVLDDAVQENLGMAMIYTLISLAQEWITVGAQARRAAAWQQRGPHGVAGCQQAQRQRVACPLGRSCGCVAPAPPPPTHTTTTHHHHPPTHPQTTPTFVAALCCAGQGLRPGGAQQRP